MRTALISTIAAGIALAAGPALAPAASGRPVPRSVSPPHAELHAQLRPRIIGGTAATAGTFPWMAFIVISVGNADDLCSGTVVSPTVILTAGHCVVSESTGAAFAASSYRVVTGAVDWTDASTRTVSAVTRTIVYPGYDPSTADRDAGLLVLAAPITAPSLPLAATSNGPLLAAGAGAVIAGWGQTYYGSNPPNVLQWAQTVAQSPAYCAAQSAGYDASSEICAADPPMFATATCFGDSGGPLIVDDSSGRPFEAGITSHGPAACDPTSPDVYTSVAPLTSWIESQIAGAPAPTPPTPTPPTAPAPTPTPAPAPTTPTTTPPAQLPQLTAADARRFAVETLQGAFPQTPRPPHRLQESCARQSRTRFSCRVSWSSDANDYAGTIRVYYVIKQGMTNWSDHYDIAWVNDRCSHSGHRRSCTIHHKQGTW